MTSKDIRKKYLDFFAKKGHAVVPSSSLVPDNDPTTLFASAGMQQMIPYLLGQRHPLGTRIANSQRCLRTQDIGEVGDNRHTTFFEMLGNWSFNDYFKEEQLSWIFEFLTKEVGLDPKNLYVTAFKGSPESGIPRDEETVKIWKKLFDGAGIKAEAADGGRKMEEGERIFYYDETKNWWSRSGVPSAMPEGELGGPDSEIFYDFGAGLKIHENSAWCGESCHVNCDCGRFMEIGNNVFMEYVRRGGKIEKMAGRNVDFGGGLERVAAASAGNPDVFKIDLFAPVIAKIEEISGRDYNADQNDSAAMRVIADHVRSAVFLVNDGVIPSNKAQGYFARRLIRRAVVKGHKLGVEKTFLPQIAGEVIGTYGNVYEFSAETIKTELEKEETKFRKTLAEGLKLIESNIEGADFFDKESERQISKAAPFKGGFAFFMYESYGFPPEMTLEIIKEKINKYPQLEKVFNEKEYWEHFNNKLKEHQELSRTASVGMFKGGLADAGAETTKLHTAAHLMLAALRRVLGPEVAQKGSNITAERLRFDFSYPQKMTAEQIKQVEDLVNGQIAKKMPVGKEEMALEDARSCGAVGAFGDKYGERVTVYKVGDFSKEICGGPHVQNTGELGEFKIAKEESSGAGVRRIKAVLIPQK